MGKLQAQDVKIAVDRVEGPEVKVERDKYTIYVTITIRGHTIEHVIVLGSEEFEPVS